MFLKECRQSIAILKGVGPKIKKDLSNSGIETIADLLTRFPRSYEDRKTHRPLSSVKSEGLVNTTVIITAQEWFGFGPKRTLKVRFEDDTGRGTLLCFGRNFLSDLLRVGESFRLFGYFQYKYGELQSSSFETEAVSRTDSQFGRILPVYPLSGSLTQGTMRKLTAQAIAGYGCHLEPELPAGLEQKRELLPLPETLRLFHYPENPEDPVKARRSFAYIELFYLQLQVARRGAARSIQKKERKGFSGTLAERLIKRIPFSLTPDQQKVIEEIRSDLREKAPMARLLQGEVGSGKTLVAFAALLFAHERNEQAAFMAPTELLARQHAETAYRLLSPLGIRIAFLSGNVRETGRKELLESLIRGEIDLVIGTHALFSTQVEFKNLGIVVVDEQHRFGVLQRLALTEKGDSPDLLLLSATPIPRTLTLTVFGDLSISTLKTMPQGRKPVETHLALHGREGKVYSWVEKEIRKGRQAYFVYPLIEQSEKIQIKNAEAMFKELSEKVFPGFSLALIHGRLPEDEKIRIMEGFVQGKTDILVSTSVVEVGVDVPNATCMVIEQAERFGLSALHQLRGRVGRGTEQSYAFMIYSPDLTEDAKRRLKVLMETRDGFLIAEEDLAIRGPGEITGVRQSGSLRFKAADLVSDRDILEEAREDAFGIIEKDPGLISVENSIIREVLEKAKPFEEDYLSSG